MNIIKRLIQAIIIFIILIAIVITIFINTIDPNDYKEKIITSVKQQTNRDLIIEKEIGWTFFPRVGFKLGGVNLNNPQGFSQKIFADIDSVNLSLAILPLLKFAVEVSDIELKGLHLNLERKKNGVTNWDDLINSFDNPESTKQENVALQNITEDDVSNIPDFYVSGININDVSVHWLDKQAEQDILLKGINLKVGSLKLNQSGLQHPVDFNINLTFQNTKPALTVEMSLSAKLDAKLNTQQYSLNNLLLELSAKGSDIPNNKQSLTLKGSINTDLQQQVISSESLTLATEDLNINTKLTVENLLDSPKALGNLSLEVASLKKLAENFGIELPATNDKEILQVFSMNSGFSATMNSIDFSQLILKLDDINVQGKININDFENPAISALINIDDINVDRYFPPTDLTQLEEENGKSNNAEDMNQKIDLPLGMLRDLNLQGEFKIKKFQAMNVKTENVNVIVNAKHGMLNINPFSLNLYKGKLKGDVILDVTKDVPGYIINTKLNSIESGPFLNDFMEINFISGIANIDLSIKTQGDSFNSLKSKLTGKANARFKNGVLKGIDISEVVAKSKRTLSNLKSSFSNSGNDLQNLANIDLESATNEAKQEIKFEPNNSKKKTEFGDLTISNRVNSGIVNTKKLILKSKKILLKASGKANLIKESIDYQVNLNRLTTDGNIKGEDLPLYAKGNMYEPSFGIDSSKIFEKWKSEQKNKIKDKAKAKVKKKKEKEKKKVKEKLDKEKDKLKDKLDDKLKDLLPF